MVITQTNPVDKCVDMRLEKGVRIVFLEHVRHRKKQIDGIEW